MIKEVVTKYKPDSIWMDGDWNIQNDVCWCGNCQRAWQLKTGKKTVPTNSGDPDWPAWLRLHYDRIDEYRIMVADAIHEIHPACMYTSNGGWRIRSARYPDGVAYDDPRSAPAFVATLSHDVAASGQGGLNQTRIYGMALSPEEDTPHDLMHQITQPSEPRTRKWAGLAKASGSPWFMFGFPSFVLSKSGVDKAEACATFVHDRDKGDVLGRSHSRNPIAILTSETSWERRRMDGKRNYWTPQTIQNVALALQDVRFGVDLINEHILNSRVRNYRALIIADNQREVLPRTADSLKAFVEAGGMLLVMGSGLLDCPGKESDVESLLGLKRTAAAEGSHALKMSGKTPSFDSVWEVETSGAEVLAAYDHGKAFLTRHRVGEGSVAYVSFAGPIPYPDKDGVIAWTVRQGGGGQDGNRNRSHLRYGSHVPSSSGIDTESRIKGIALDSGKLVEWQVPLASIGYRSWPRAGVADWIGPRRLWNSYWSPR